MTLSRIPSILAALFLLTVAPVQVANAQCEADHTIVMADYYFAPSELTIVPGETVAFVNVQGTHDINGITNTLTGEPWNNPAEFYLEQTEGTEEGTCMGVVTFDIPGVYNFDSSIGFQAQLVGLELERAPTGHLADDEPGPVAHELGVDVLVGVGPAGDGARVQPGLVRERRHPCVGLLRRGGEVDQLGDVVRVALSAAPFRPSGPLSAEHCRRAVPSGRAAAPAAV